MNAGDLHTKAVVADTHNDLILLVDHFDQHGQPNHFADFWLPELRAGGVDVQVLPICLEEQFQSEGGLRRTLLLVERIHRIAADHPDDVAICLTGADVDAATAAGKIALIVALEGAHGIGQDPGLIRTMQRVGVRVVSMAHLGRTFLADGSGFDEIVAEPPHPSRHRGLPGDGTARNRLRHQPPRPRRRRATFWSSRSVRSSPPTRRASVSPTSIATWETIRSRRSRHWVAWSAWRLPSRSSSTARIRAPDRVVDHIEHIINLTGIDSVGLGPDFIDDYYSRCTAAGSCRPSSVTIRPTRSLAPVGPPEDHRGDGPAGFSESDIFKVLGGNVVRVLPRGDGCARLSRAEIGQFDPR